MPPTRRRNTLRIAAFSLALFSLLCGAATVSVNVGQGGTNFVPDTINIQLGDTVTWTWVANNHSVTSGTSAVPDGVFDAGAHNNGFTFPTHPTTAKSIPYFCRVHGIMMTGTPTPIPTATPTSTAFPFTSRSLVFPPVTTAAEVPIGISEACISILDGPCTNMWTYGGTYPGLTIRRPTGQTTRVTFANNLPSPAGGKTVHHHGIHSASADDGQVTGTSFLFEPGQTRTYTYDGVEAGENERGFTATSSNMRTTA